MDEISAVNSFLSLTTAYSRGILPIYTSDCNNIPEIKCGFKVELSRTNDTC